MNWRSNLLLTAVLLITSLRVLGVGERKLQIQRYPDEPMQLTDLRISGESVKDRIVQLKTYQNKWSTDSVSFNDTEDWYKRLSFTYKNVSDKPVRGVRAFLFFKPEDGKKTFMVQLTSLSDLWKNALQPGEEVEIILSDIELAKILPAIQEEGVDLNSCAVSFSLDTAIYGEKLWWDRGHLLHPDPTQPNKWIPVNEP
jgi:hypothetical protein